MKTLISMERINIRGYGFHNPFSSGISKASDPRINSLTLARISHSRDIGIRNICAENLRDRMERLSIDPRLLPLFNQKVLARAVSYVRFGEMPSVSRRADRLYDWIVTFVGGCSPECLKMIASISENDFLLGLIVFDRLPEERAELAAFSLIAAGKSSYAKIACERILAFWPDLNMDNLKFLGQKAVQRSVKDTICSELKRRSGVGR